MKNCGEQDLTGQDFGLKFLVFCDSHENSSSRIFI